MSNRSPVTGNSDRSGATLIEVLMSIMIMSIGLVSVFTLFPLALMSSIRSTQLTTASLFYQQIQSQVLSNPSLLLGAKPWAPGMTIYPGDIVCDPLQEGVPVPDGINYFFYPYGSEPIEVTQSAPYWETDDAPATGRGMVRISQPTDDISTFQFISRPDPLEDQVRKYVVDPYGYDNEINGALKGFLGNFPNPPTPPVPPLVRISGARPSMNDLKGVSGSDLYGAFGVDPMGLFNTVRIDELGFGSPDTWSVLETIPNVQYEQGTIPATTRLGSLVTYSESDKLVLLSDPKLSRVLAVDQSRGDGRIVSHLANNTLPTSNSFYLEPPISSLPDGQIGFADLQIEQFERRYTWMASVIRKKDSKDDMLDVQIAVFFNRSFNPVDEQSYSYEEFQALGIPFVMHDYLIVHGNGQSPYIKEGGYAFDTTSCRWHSIRSVKPVGDDDYEVVLAEREVPLTGEGRIARGGRLVFMPGIVKVFPLNFKVE